MTNSVEFYIHLKYPLKNKSIIKTFPTIKNENMASRLLGKY